MCRYVLCQAHMGHFSPYINLTSDKMGWLLMAVASSAGVHVTFRQLRSTMVINHVLRSLLAGESLKMQEMYQQGGWTHGPSAATMSNYYHPQGSEGAMAPLVCHPFQICHAMYVF